MKKILVVAGPTAVGKTEYAIKLAEDLNGEIVSCDSMQLYRYMDIGSAKPTTEEQSRIKHYLVDEINPADEFSVAEYQKLAKKYINEIFNKKKIPVIAGGTGLYLNSLLYDMDFATEASDDKIRKKYYSIAEEHGNQYLHDILMDKSPKLAARIHPNNIKKIVRALETIELGCEIEDFAQLDKKNTDYQPVMICLNRNREELYDRINKRADILIESGLLNEVKMLMDMGFTADNIAMKGIGYKEIIGYFNNEYDLNHAVWLLKRNTRRYAKRQLTWFRRYDDMKWFNLSESTYEDILQWVKTQL